MSSATTAGLPSVLIVDDELVSLKLISLILEETGIARPVLCQDSRQAITMIGSGAFSLVLLDLHMPYISGDALLGELSKNHPDIPVIVLTSEDKVETAVTCMKHGAFDFMTKPVDKNRLLPAIRNALTLRDLRNEVRMLSSRDSGHTEPVHPEYFGEFLTSSARMRSLFAYIEAIARSPRAVLVTGESGTGKELIARIIHNVSGRSGSFVPINVSGLDDTVFSDSLFGHLKGSYTGADSVRKGLVEQSRDGTLFLDEIGDLDQGPQIKLLRLLQENEYYPMGSDTPMHSRSRIIAATNADLSARQENGLFRKDLYYRLMSHRVELPPLRERLEDIPLLVAHFVAESALVLKRPSLSVDARIHRMLKAHSFPGNVRELQALVFDAFSRCQDERLEPRHFHRTWDLPPELDRSEGCLEVASPSSDSAAGDSAGGAETKPGQLLRGPADVWVGDSLPDMGELEDFLYQLALDRSNGKQARAASLLGISQSTLSRWLKDQQKA